MRKLSDYPDLSEIPRKILEEAREIQKLRDVSILDELEPQSSEKLVNIIHRFANKQDLAEQFIEIMPLHYDSAGLWWRWDSARRCWVIHDDVDILNLVEGASGANIVSSKERTEILNALKQRARRNKPEDKGLLWLQFKEEIVNIETGERFIATPKHFMTNPIPHKLGCSDETPTMDRIFEEWVGKEYVQTLYEIIAYTLLPSYPLHRIFCFIGGGMNGKSKYLDLIRRFIGNENCCSTELDTLLTSRFEVTKLHKKLVCQMGETNFSEMKKTSMLKKLSGGDLIGFEYKNKNPFEAVNYAKILISTNNLPATSDKTIGFYRRWLIIDFPNQFSERKEILDEIPREEYENLATKCIKLLMDLLNKREFYNEGDIEERMRRYEEKSDPVQKFMKEFCDTEDPNAFITKNQFEKKLNDWLKENRFRTMSDRSIKKIMSSNGIESDKAYIDWWEGEVKTNKQVRVWRGIDWLQD